MESARESLRTLLHRVVEASADDGLRAATRRRILASIAPDRAASRAAGRLGLSNRWFRAGIPSLAAAAALLVFLVLPALVPRTQPQREAPASPVRDLRVSEKDGRVVLTWKDGGAPRRVVRATSREQLRHLDQLPGVLVSGERWSDAVSDDEPIVYYVVE